MRLQDKVCLITGGGKGIGAATAIAFAREGAWVEIGDVDTAAGQETAQAIENELGKRAVATHVDVTDARSVARWAADIMGRHGRIDVLFNNAGISAVGPLHEIDQSLWERVMAVNVTGVYLVSRAVLPIMMDQKSGSVINMSSCIAALGLMRRAAYAATKGAILSMTKSMQVDYAPYGIRVNALMPGTIYTPFVQDYIERSYDDPQSAIQGLKARQLGGELGTPEDVAMAAVYLASDESKYVMGTGLAVDGGVTAGKFS
ncbi:glucose 1-dehydrogenase [Alicyclobacillus cycloheptanicus]|uniref:NAD(P)-dependent dehydrogenase (Short-subunit alcohol dehydrogenase family) n=1 Tax=Alicyclobacillus cycloheptanicus TaxID=1457 RepID=A0ABT9XGT3_9BACL|nr:glucose 1-dehydrogenase [Alicyclobacillus cycloheptanicus]MDQ0189516.1 NAD(P)-dependent dehydrogenase (short-subunit alcohol dehydrogenase family) [Alicyclobacillus cycloheptanicus]WDM01578.1 glucose 1-dehydrogenase [Alicyclobacillus cycloheptanicus]